MRRYFHAAIATGTPLARAARLRMRRSIELTNRWGTCSRRGHLAAHRAAAPLRRRLASDRRGASRRHIPIAGERATLHVTIGDDGLARSDHLDRWNDPDGTGTFGWHPFGIEIGACSTFQCGISMPAVGVGGWFHGTERWQEGKFFRYTISELTLI